MDERGKRKQKWLCGFTSRADAERALTEALASLDRGTYVEPSKLSLERYLLDEWLPACGARIRATTVESYRDLTAPTRRAATIACHYARCQRHERMFFGLEPSA